MHAVEIDALSRVFRRGRGRSLEEVVALDDVTFAIEEGEIHGLLGPNGAGKTTLVKILATILLPTSGTARVLGRDVVRETAVVRRLIGIVVGGERGLYGRLTARQNLRYWASLHRLPDAEARRRADELLERMGLARFADQRVESFSRGMRQRLHLARGLVSGPRVLFLDEPTTGMDPIAAREFRSLVTGLRDEGVTVLLTTHDMVEAESVCDRVALIDRGSLLAVERPRTLASWIARFERIDAEAVPQALLEEIAALDGVSTVVSRGDGGVRIETDAEGATREVLRRLVEAGVTSIRTSLPSLEEVYLHVIGRRGLEV